MNYRKDIFERMTYIVKTETSGKPNYAKLARQFNCDYRTVKQYYEAASKGIEKPPERKIKKKTDGYEQIIQEKLKTGAPAIAIFHYLREEKDFKGSYSTLAAANSILSAASLRFQCCKYDRGELTSIILEAVKEAQMNEGTAASTIKRYIRKVKINPEGIITAVFQNGAEISASGGCNHWRQQYKNV